jgi:hypothetical protein
MTRIILTLLLLLLTFLAQAQTEITPVEAELSIGRYSVDCSGRGTCSFTIGSSFSRLGKPAIKISAKKTSPSTFVITIPISKLSKEDELNMAGKLFSEIKTNDEIVFIQEEPLVLDDQTIRSLGIDKPYTTIAAGVYPMNITKNKVEITFTLTPSE